MSQSAAALDKGIETMAKNIGPEDRVVRIVVGLALAVLAYLGVLPGIPTIIMAILAAYLIITGLVARCLFYKLADIDTSVQEQPYSTTDDRAGL
jgi:flagellar biosynthesis component FlhA